MSNSSAIAAGRYDIIRFVLLGPLPAMVLFLYPNIRFCQKKRTFFRKMRPADLQKRASVLIYASFSRKTRERLLENWAAQCACDAERRGAFSDAMQSVVKNETTNRSKAPSSDGRHPRQFEKVEPKKARPLHWRTARSDFRYSHMESLILAQNERWRHGLGMQVERESVFGRE